MQQRDLAEPGPGTEAPDRIARGRDLELALGASGVLPVPVRFDEQVDEASLRGAPLFAALSEEDLARVRWVARNQRVRAGEAIVRHWELGTDFFVILAGEANVIRDRVEVDRMGPGDFFGEFAAMKWGADFSYSRLASVTALTDMQVAVFAAPALASLMVDVPSIDHAISRVRRTRLARMQAEAGPD